MMSLSLQRSLSSLFSLTVVPDGVPVLDGVRSLSLLWVIMGHIYLAAIAFPKLEHVLPSDSQVPEFQVSHILHVITYFLLLFCEVYCQRPYCCGELLLFLWISSDSRV